MFRKQKTCLSSSYSKTEIALPSQNRKEKQVQKQCRQNVYHNATPFGILLLFFVEDVNVTVYLNNK